MDGEKLPRTSPELPVLLGETVVRLTYLNTYLQAYPKDYWLLSHVAIDADEFQGRVFLPEVQALWSLLREHHYPLRWEFFPSDEVINDYCHEQASHLPDSPPENLA